MQIVVGEADFRRARPGKVHRQDVLDVARMNAHQHDPIGQEYGLINVVGHKNNCGRKGFPDLKQNLLQNASGLGIQGRKRLIHQQNGWVSD